jgi:hypothetical protein
MDSAYALNKLSNRETGTHLLWKDFTFELDKVFLVVNAAFADNRRHIIQRCYVKGWIKHAYAVSGNLLSA